MRLYLNLGILLLLFIATLHIHAENGAEGWLRYAPISNAAVANYATLPNKIVVLGKSSTDEVVGNELQRGLTSMLGRSFTISHELSEGDNAILVANLATLNRAFSVIGDKLSPDSFTIGPKTERKTYRFIILGADSRGELYGAFHLLELIASEQPLPTKPATESPSSSIRWINQWDNLDGTIERGYAGRSIFYENGHVRADLTRVHDYGRLLASIGINGITVNNVNSDLHTLEPEMILEFARIADEFRPWGIRMSLSVDLSSPQVVGHLPTFDPVDPTVITWWKTKVDEIYKAIPDFGGFVIKADSEGRVGPSQYHRTPAEAANAVARPLKPHGGFVLYRGFVYNNHLDYTDLKADRARAGYDNFRALDGKFESNVVIQIKNGPIDFQVREPASPLFAALQHTSQAIELQVTQEYLGQQRHMVFLVPMWKTTLDTDMRADNRSTPVNEIVEGRSFHQPLGGFVGVANVGLDANWMHHPMAMANLYGFGRLAWNPNLSTNQILDTWTRLTWGNNDKVVSTIDELQRHSWRVYEQYTGNLGIGTLTNILGYHFGPGIESAEHNGWGQWFRADATGIGMDRTVATGTGYIGQYPPELAKVYEDVNTCPDDLLLFMHHVPYTHVLHDGKTVVQSIYDAHYEGAATAQTYPTRWQTLHGLIDEDRYNHTLKLLTYQAGHAIVWRDAVTRWFQKESNIPDEQGRVGNYPNRIEAENMTAEGYTPIDVKPWETASNSKAVLCDQPTGCTLTTKLDNPAGTYTITVQYFDFWSGKSHFALNLNGKPIGNWLADETLPPARAENQPNGDTSTRITFPNIVLKPGDTLTLHGTPNNTEPAPVDYIEITKQ
ncbi:MAG TPA: alpha-glucuronidase family glycosyl hydrolase [Edaphobacter sp.]|jgi:alpha-glucuronidase|nr:alpha-glucuronidase family glycosyl hydrolase [Edaphobacter sp.]